MRLQPATLVLGDQRWTVRPLTVAQVQAIEPLLAASTADPAATITSAVAILKVALGRDHPEAAGGLDGMEAGAPAIAAALATVLRLGGYLPDDAEGTAMEAPGKPEAGAPSTGPRSMPG